MYKEVQLRNFRTALAEVRRRGLDDVYAQQTLAGMLTECTGYNYANPLYPWTLPVSDGYPPRELSPSTKESCGVFQQRPHIPVWWGPQGLSIADQALYFMNVRQAVGLFLDRLVGTTRTNQPWNQIQEVQGSEYNGTTLPYAANYRDQWEAAGQLLALLNTETKPSTDWLDMATEQEKAEYAKQIADQVKAQRPVDFYIYQDENGLWMANLLAGTTWAFPDLETRASRQFVLETAGYIVKAWDGGKQVAEPGAFGQRVAGVVPGHKVV